MRSAFNDGSSYCVTAVNINPKRTREWRALYESDPKSQLLLTAFSLLEARKVCEGTSLPHIYRTRESRPPPSKTKTGLTSSVEASFIGTPFVFDCIVLSLVRAGILIIYELQIESFSFIVRVFFRPFHYFRFQIVSRLFPTACFQIVPVCSRFYHSTPPPPCPSPLKYVKCLASVGTDAVKYYVYWCWR